MSDKFDKILSFGVCIFGAVLGVQLADMTAPMCKEPRLLGVGKEVAGGVIFGMAGYKAGHEVYSMIPKFEKGDAK